MTASDAILWPLVVMLLAGAHMNFDENTRKHYAWFWTGLFGLIWLIGKL